MWQVNTKAGGRLRQTILRVALPAVASSLLMTLFSSVDAFWVGTRIGSAGLAAVSTSLFWIWAIISLAEMVGVGLTSVAARRIGERRRDEAARLAGDFDGGVSAGTRAVQQLKQVVTAIKLLPLAEAVNVPFVTQFVDEDGVVQANEVMEQAATAMLDELVLVERALRGLREQRAAAAHA